MAREFGSRQLLLIQDRQGCPPPTRRVEPGFTVAPHAGHAGAGIALSGRF